MNRPNLRSVRPMDPAEITRIFGGADHADAHRGEPLNDSFIHRPTWRDDLREFVHDIRDNIGLAIVCTASGLLVGMAVTVGLAWIIATVAF